MSTRISDNNLPAWWKEAVIYQIYPRSFKDSDGDGVGDLQGIISKLEYIKSLGVDAVWLNPIFSSPNDDNGYDISDYKNIMSEFGAMNDFDELLQGMHARGLKLVLDLVANHSSEASGYLSVSRIGQTTPIHRIRVPRRYTRIAPNRDRHKASRTGRGCSALALLNV